MYLRRRSERPSRRREGSDAEKRQAGDDSGDSLTVLVETISGGQLVTLTHAIINDAIETLPPDVPIAPSIISSSVSEIALTTEQLPPASETEAAAVESETEAAFTTEALILSSLSDVPTAESTTFTTSILPDVISASAIATSTGDLDSQISSEEDPDRLPAIGITIGALAGAGVVIGAGVMLYRWKHGKRMGMKTGEKRLFQEI